MFKQQELEIIDLIYTIKNSNISYKLKIDKIQKTISDYIQSNRIKIKADFLDRYITIDYGIVLKRRQSTFDYQGKIEYRNLVLDPIIDASAGLDSYDCFNKSTDGYPIFICMEKMFAYNIDSFSDLKNGHILDQILQNNRYETHHGVDLLDRDNYKPVIKKIDVTSYLTTDDLFKLNVTISIVSLATKVCTDLIDNHHLLSEYNNDMLKRIDDLCEHTDNILKHSESIDNRIKSITTEVMMKQLAEENPIVHDEIIEFQKNIVDTEHVDHYNNIVNDIINYVDGIFDSHYKNFTDCTQLKTSLGATRLSRFIETPELDVGIDRLQCIRQFLRLVKVLTQKTAYAYDVPEELSASNIGELHADGTFNKNFRLIDIIIQLIENITISPEDIDYIVDLYSDRSYVVGLAIKHSDKPKPESTTIKLDMYSQFA